MSVPDEYLAVDLSNLSDAEPEDGHPPVCSLGDLAREYLLLGIPPVPTPTVGHIEGVELPMFYPGLNGIAGPAGTAKSLILKYLARQMVQAEKPQPVLVLDCETSKQEYLTTMMLDFEMMNPEEIELIRYATDKRRSHPDRAKWSGLVANGETGEPLLELLLDRIEVVPGLAVIDSQSKSMANMGLDENSPQHCATWYETVAEPIVDRWPDIAVVMVQGRQKGWAVGMDVRQGRGSSSMLHEVDAQYMVWTVKPGSRTVDGLVKVVSTKSRWGHRTEGELAAAWKYGPSGLYLVSPKELPADSLPTLEETREMVLGWFENDPRELENKVEAHLPVKRADAVDRMKKDIVLVSAAGKGWPALLGKALSALIKEGEVHCHQLAQSGTRGQPPWRVWTGDADPEWRWEK